MQNGIPNCQEAPEIPLYPPFPKGEPHNFFSPSIEKALLPLKKGGGEGFLERFFKRLNCYKDLNLKRMDSGACPGLRTGVRRNDGEKAQTNFFAPSGLEGGRNAAKN